MNERLNSLQTDAEFLEYIKNLSDPTEAIQTVIYFHQNGYFGDSYYLDFEKALIESLQRIAGQNS